MYSYVIFQSRNLGLFAYAMFSFYKHNDNSNVPKLPFVWVMTEPNSQGSTVDWATRRWSACGAGQPAVANPAPDIVPRLGRPKIPICDLQQ